MSVFDELKARGMIAQMTNEEKIRDLMENQKSSSISASIPRQIACMWAISCRLW